MENQHRKIKGYRELSKKEIHLMNKVKSLGEELGSLIVELEREPSADKRWVAMAKTDLQVGIMKAVRAVAKPETF